MANRATAAFIFSIIGAAYQMTSLFVAVLVDRSTSYYYYNLGYEALFFTSFFVIWGASHILEEWKGRITWPAVILGLGIASLSTIILTYYSQAQPSPILVPSNVPTIGAILALICGPLLIIIGGILGFSAVQQYSREHGRAVIARA